MKTIEDLEKENEHLRDILIDLEVDYSYASNEIDKDIRELNELIEILLQKKEYLKYSKEKMIKLEFKIYKLTDGI